MLTFAQFTGATLVPATSQVTFCVVLLVHVTAVLGVVTRNGPALPLTCNVMVSWLTPLHRGGCRVP